MKKAWKSMAVALAAVALLSACKREDVLSDLDEPQAQAKMMVSDKDVTTEPPPGWQKEGMGRAAGITVWYRINPNDAAKKDYVLEVNLTLNEVRNQMGAGPVATSTTPNPSFTYWNTTNFWSNRPSGTIAMVNGSFFESMVGYGKVTLPVKQNGSIITIGSKNCNGLSKRRLGFSGTRAYVSSYSFSSTDCPTTSTALGLTTVANKLAYPTETVGYDPGVSANSTTRMGRSYAGIRDINGDGTYETVYFAVTPYLTQAEVMTFLTSFSVNPAKIVQFDGSGSARLIVDGVSKVPSSDNRVIPQMFAILPR